MRFLIGVLIGVGLAACLLLAGIVLAFWAPGPTLGEVLSGTAATQEALIPPLVLPSPVPGEASTGSPAAGGATTGPTGMASPPPASWTPTFSPTLTLFPTLTLTLTPTWTPSPVPSPTEPLPTPTPAPSPTPQEAAAQPPGIPPLEDFAAQVQGGGGHTPVGLYLPEHLAARVVPQPPDNPAYVPFQPDQVALFRLAVQYNVWGFLAHNTLAGAAFFALQEGDVFYVLFGDGKVQPFLVTRVLRYQALSPNSPYSDFIDLQTGERLTATQVFHRTYGAARGGAVLQTCIARNGLDNWGRLFLLARPLSP